MAVRNEQMPNAFLIGKHIYLRGATPDDAEICAPWFNDPVVNRYLASGRRPNTVEQSREFITRAMNSEHDVMFAVIERRSGRYIGNAGLHRIHPVYRSAVFGIMIGIRECWRRGYGTEVTRLVTGYAFDRLNLNRLELEVAAENERARRIYSEAGYRTEGVRRQAMYVEGRYIDTVIMSILRAEWEEAASPSRSRPGGGAGADSGGSRGGHRESRAPRARPRTAGR